MVDKVRQPSAPTMFEPMDGPTMLSLSDSRVVTPKAARQISETLGFLPGGNQSHAGKTAGREQSSIWIRSHGDVCFQSHLRDTMRQIAGYLCQRTEQRLESGKV